MTDQDVLFRTRPLMIRARPIGFAFSVALIPVYGLGIAILLYWWLSIVSSELVVTPQRVRKRAGILSNRVTELVHRDVKNIQVSQGPIQNFMGTGTLRLSSAGQAGIELTMTDIEDPQHIRDLIYSNR